jgi:RND family efflux transporter MFP subunit
MRKIWFTPILLLPILLGCTSAAQEAPPPKPTEVQVSVPVVRVVTDYEDFTGRTESVASVEVRSRTTGYLDSVNFKDGSLVAKGEILFEIDPRPYQSELRRVEASLTQAEARLQRLEADFKRAQALFPQRVMSKEEFDKVAGERAEAQAAVGVAKANLGTAKLQLDFTKVTAPISGRVSRREKDPGNLIKADDTLLTTIVALDPMYATFEVDERTVLKLRRLVEAGKIPSFEEKDLPILLGLADEEGFPTKGKINFVDNKVDSGTGTLRVRGIFANPRFLFSPGLFLRVRLQIGVPHKALLIADRALGTDQGQKYLYVVNDQDVVEYRPVKIGPLHDGLRVVEKGLQEGEKIVVSGLQRVREGTQVQPKLVEMPLLKIEEPKGKGPAPK